MLQNMNGVDFISTNPSFPSYQLSIVPLQFFLRHCHRLVGLRVGAHAASANGMARRLRRLGAGSCKCLVAGLREFGALCGMQTKLPQSIDTNFSRISRSRPGSAPIHTPLTVPSPSTINTEGVPGIL